MIVASVSRPENNATQNRSRSVPDEEQIVITARLNDEKGGESAGRCQSRRGVSERRPMVRSERHPSTTRMALLVNRLEAAVFNVRVDLSCADTGVAQHFL